MNISNISPGFLRIFFAVCLITFGCIACRSYLQQSAERSEEYQITITSAAFDAGKAIQPKYTCDGQDVSPPLSWTGVPSGTESLVLITEDPDAPIGTWIHWIIFDIPPQIEGLEEGISGVGIQGNNSWKENDYGGPCPPAGNTHRYYFQIFALDTVLGLQAGASKADVEAALNSHMIARGQLVGTYSR